MNKIKIKLKKSRFGRIPQHRKILKALGLKKIGHIREVYDRPEIRGMLNKVRYLIEEMR
ncbi:MAG: 50S ribosomal protein L30 [Candidatus Hydrogenedentota bacterium]